METGLQGKRVLVTGGSGGIGAACVRLLAAEGTEVVVHYHRNREGALAAGGAAVVQADLGTRAMWRACSTRPASWTAARRSQACGRRRTSQSGSCRSSAGAPRSTRT